MYIAPPSFFIKQALSIELYLAIVLFPLKIIARYPELTIELYSAIELSPCIDIPKLCPSPTPALPGIIPVFFIVLCPT